MSKKKVDIYKLAIDTFGEQSQIDQAIEEMAELIQALQKLRRYKASDKLIFSVIDEIADVANMIEQLSRIFGSARIEQVREKKLKRLRGRIKRVEAIKGKKLVAEGNGWDGNLLWK